MSDTQPADAPQAEVPDHTACQARIAELEQKWKRALADLVNAEKQHERARQEHAKFAAADVLRALLPIVDSVQAAAAHLHECEAIASQLERFLAEHRVTPTAQEGVTVDYLLHEIVGQESYPDTAPGAIVRVAQQGYALHDRCLRPAKVIVAAESIPVSDTA
ncbi:MAG: nucleotide exchange factor GrpE [bacterium]|nr:nucleotide exchange factor GrpE [bacterium]